LREYPEVVACPVAPFQKNRERARNPKGKRGKKKGGKKRCPNKGCQKEELRSRLVPRINQKGKKG